MSRETEQRTLVANLLIEAAAGAEALLPSMEKRRVELARELTELESQITRLRTIVYSAAPYRTPQEQQVSETIIGAGLDIDRVLFDSDGPMKVSDIRKQIKKQMDRAWASSTISNHLSRGKADGCYVNEGGSWKLSHKGVSEARITVQHEADEVPASSSATPAADTDHQQAVAVSAVGHSAPRDRS